MNRSSSKRERVSSGKVAMFAGLLAALPGLVALAPHQALAGDVFSDWNAAVDGNWEDAGNWTPAQVPTNGIDHYFVTITAGGSPYTIWMNSGFSLSDLVLNSSDVTLSFQPGANALNIGGTGGITVTQGTLSFDGGAAFVPFINVSNPSQFVLNTGFVGINGNSQIIPLDGTSLFNDLNLNWNQSLLVQAADGSYSSGINLTAGSTLTIDGGGLWVNLLQNNGGSFVFNQGLLHIDNPSDTLVIGPSGLFAGDYINTWGRRLRHTGTLQVENGATLTLEGGALEVGALDLSQGGTFVWQDGLLVLYSDVVIEDGNATAPFVNGQELQHGQYFAIGGDLTVGNTSPGLFTVSGWYASEVQGNLYIGRQAGSDNSALFVGNSFTYNNGHVQVLSNVFVGGDGINEGGVSELVVGPYSHFTTNGLLHIHSSSTLSAEEYANVTAGRILWEGSRHISDASFTLTDTFELIVDDNYNNNFGATTSNPFGSSLFLSTYGGSLRELSVNNFLSVGYHGGNGSFTMQGEARLTVGGVLTFGSGAVVDIDMDSGYYYGGLIEANDISTFDADPANLRFRNANFQLNTLNSLVIDPSAYQFGGEVYVDGNYQREDPNNPGIFIDYNFNSIHVPNGQIIVGNTGYGKLVVNNYTQGVESKFMIIGGDAPGATGEVEVRNSNQLYNNEYGDYLYQGIRINDFLGLGVYDLPITQSLTISDYGGVSVGDQLTVGSAVSTHGNITGELVQQYNSDLAVGGMFTVQEYGRYRGENGGTLAVGSFDVHPNADFSVFGIALILGNDNSFSDLTIAAGELFGDTMLVDPRGSNFHTEDPAVTLLTRLQLRHGSLDLGTGGKLTIQDPDQYYYYYNANVDVSDTTTVAHGAELHLLNRGSLRTGQLIVQPGGLFNWEDGFLSLTSSNLVMDSTSGSLPIGSTVIIDNYNSNTARRGLEVSGQLTVGHGDQGTLDVISGNVSVGNLLIGGAPGGQGQVKVGVLNQFNYSSLYVSTGDIALGGDTTDSFGADSALLEINTSSSVQVGNGVVRIWDNHQVILHGGTLTTQNVIKDDGNGIFSSSNFQFNGGTLQLTNADLTLDNGQLLGNHVDLTSGKNLYVNSFSVYDPINNIYVYPYGLTTVESGATLSVNGGQFSTRRLLVKPGGTFNLLAGTFQLTGDDLIIDPVTGQLPQLVNPGNTSIQVTNGKLIVGDVDFGLMDLGSGTISSRGALFGRNPGSTFTASVGKPDGSIFNSLNSYSGSDELVLGGTETAAGGTGTFTIHPNASVNYNFGNLRIWDGSRMILDGGFLRVRDIVKNDGTGVFTHGPTPDFTFNAGSLFLRTNQALDTGTALGNNLVLDGNKLLDIQGQLTINDAAALTLSGGTLSVNQLQKIGTGSFAFSSGTLNLRQQDGVVDSVNPTFFLGDNFTFGANTRFNLTHSSFSFVVGQDGNGTATFNGGPVNNAFAGGQGSISGQIGVGLNPGSTGTLNVGDGATSGYLSASSFSNYTYIGKGGVGNLNVLSGGRADFRRLYVASGTGSTGTVTVHGTNSQINITGNVHLGGDESGTGGNANVYVQNNGSFNLYANSLHLHAGGSLYVQGGSVYMGSITNLGGRIHFSSGLLQVSQTGLTIGLGEALGSAVTIPTLSTFTIGSNNTLSSFNIANDGSVANHGNLNAIAVNVQQGGLLSGNGQISLTNFFTFANGGGLRVENAGTLAPGASAGIFTINGSWYGTRFIQTSTGKLQMELGGNGDQAPVAGTHYDQLVVHGTNSTLFLDGVLELLSLGSAGKLTDVYQIIRYQGTRTGTFSSIQWIDGFIGTIAYDVNVGGGWKAVTITNIPEPASMLLLTLGGTMLLGRRRAG